MAKISQAYVAKMALIIRNYHLVPVGDNSLYKTYLSAIFSAMEFSDNQKDDSIQRTLLPILKGSYDELVKNFLVNDRGTFRSINLRGIGTHEDVIRMHFKTYFPEIELGAVRSKLLTNIWETPEGIKIWQAQNTVANFQFILGVMLAVTGAVLLTAALATLFIVGSSTGVVLPVIAGTIGGFGLFAGSSSAARGLAERETHSIAYKPSGSA